MASLFAIASAFAILIGFVSLSQATNGIGLIAIGCWLAIGARITQASAHNARILDALASRPEIQAVRDLP